MAMKGYAISSSDGFIISSIPVGGGGSYSSAEMQSVYSLAPVRGNKKYLIYSCKFYNYPKKPKKGEW